MRKYTIGLGIIAFTVSAPLSVPAIIQARTIPNIIMNSNELPQNNQILTQLPTQAQLPTQPLIVPEAEEAYLRAREYDMNDEIDEAIAEYTKATQLDPDYAEAYLSRSVVRAMNHVDLALEDARKAKELFIEQDNQFAAGATESHIQDLERGIEEGVFKNSPN